MNSIENLSHQFVLASHHANGVPGTNNNTVMLNSLSVIHKAVMSASENNKENSNQIVLLIPE